MNENRYYKFVNKENADECFYATSDYPIAGEGFLMVMGLENDYIVENISKEEYEEATKED